MARTVVVTVHDPVCLETVDALARVVLEVRRTGGDVEVRTTSTSLRGLLDLAGLTTVVRVIEVTH